MCTRALVKGKYVAEGFQIFKQRWKNNLYKLIEFYGRGIMKIKIKIKVMYSIKLTSCSGFYNRLMSWSRKTFRDFGWYRVTLHWIRPTWCELTIIYSLIYKTVIMVLISASAKTILLQPICGCIPFFKTMLMVFV